MLILALLSVGSNSSRATSTMAVVPRHDWTVQGPGGRYGYVHLYWVYFGHPEQDRVEHCIVVANKRVVLTKCNVAVAAGIFSTALFLFLSWGSYRHNKAPAPNRRPRFPLGLLRGFLYRFSAPPASSAAVGEARR